MNKITDYFLSFIEEMIWDPKYYEWVGGRIEVFIPTEQYNIEEIRFFCKRDKKWNEFREKYDFKDVTKKVLDFVRQETKKHFYKQPR